MTACPCCILACAICLTHGKIILKRTTGLEDFEERMNASELLDQHIERLLEASGKGGIQEMPPEELSALDDCYWERAEDVCRTVLKNGKRRMVLESADRLLVDLGVVDFRFLSKDHSKLKDVLLRELYQPAPDSVQYLSESLSDFHRRFHLMRSLGEEGVAKTTAGQGEQEPSEKLQEGLRGFYQRLGRALDNLPGVARDVVSKLKSGELDRAILNFTADHDPRAEKLRAFRDKILNKARSRVQDLARLEMFDQMKQMETLFFLQASDVKSLRARSGKPIRAAVEEGVDFLHTQFRLIRSLLKLGAAGSGIARIHSVLLEDAVRVTKADVVKLLPVLHEVDAELPDSTVLLAPFSGVGFFEWDRDMLVVPVQPTRDIVSTVIAAFAHYRVMADVLHEESRLYTAYQDTFGKNGNFRQDFIRDYQNWVLRVGDGFRGGVDGRVFDFFQAHIGPRKEHLFAPASLAKQTTEERDQRMKEIQGRIDMAEDTAADRYALGILLGLAQNMAGAISNLKMAVKMNPLDERTLFTLGHVYEMRRDTRKAQELFRTVVNLAGRSIWQVYAADRLSKGLQIKR